MPSIQIRPARPEDAPALQAIYAPYVTDTAISFEYDPPSVEAFRERICHTLEKFPYLVAEEDGMIVGYCYASPFRTREAYCHVAELSVYIRKDKHGLGIGKRLYAEMEKRLVLQNIYTVYASIAYTNRVTDAHLTDGSLRFHEKMGFYPVARISDCGCKFGLWYGIVYMEKDIGTKVENPPPFRPWKEAYLLRDYNKDDEG